MEQELLQRQEVINKTKNEESMKKIQEEMEKA